MNDLTLASVVTKNCLKEFLLTKYSAALFHDCKWYVACDKYSEAHLKSVGGMTLIPFDLDDNVSDHNSNDNKSREQFLKIILNKFTALEVALQENPYCLFLDSDMLFVNKFDLNILKALEDQTVDFVVSPHYSRDPMNEDKHGFYNVGMFALNKASNMVDWKHLTVNCDKLGLYYEQKPFELILSSFKTLNLPINYNIGWWRFNNQRTQRRLEQLTLHDNEIRFGLERAVNFHFHVFKNPSGFNPGQFLVDKAFQLLKASDKEEYKQILEYCGQLSKASI